MEQPIQAYWHLVGKDRLAKTKHAHETIYEIIQPWSEEGYFMIKDRLYPLKAGAMIFVDGSGSHCSVPKDPARYVRNKLIVSSLFLQEMCALAGAMNLLNTLFNRDEGGSFLPFEFTLSERIDGIFHRMEQVQASGGPACKLKLASLLLELAAIAYENRFLPVLPEHNPVDQALLYLHENYMQPVTLAQICSHVHVNAYYLCHVFQKTTGTTIMRYLLEKRLFLAKQQLLCSKDSISEVALSCGFGSASYFTACFRRETGCTPTAYRQNIGCERKKTVGPLSFKE